MENKNKVFCALSGGVDSSVAALLLKQAGHDVTGVFMRCYNLDGCAEQDATDARRVAEHIGISFYVFDFEEEYKKAVVNYMIEGYRLGITPNPDVECNREIKFGLFLKRALEMGADYVATGHYVKLAVSDQRLGLRGKNPELLNAKRYTLYAAKDTSKDQSYFLWTLTREQLKHCLFPIGDYLKSEVRDMARKAGLPTAEKKDSQGICFLGRVRLDDFLKNYIPEKRGEVLSVSGAKIGEHDGVHFYTIGQRHIGVANRRLSRIHPPKFSKKTLEGKGDTKPFYVVEKDVAKNTVVVAEGSDNPALYRKEIGLSGVNFIDPGLIPLIRPSTSLRTGASRGYEVMARVRYRQPLARASLKFTTSQVVRLVFDNPQKFVAPGQSAVFYSKEGELLGGGIILD